MAEPCGCCPTCGALPGHQNPSTGQRWQHTHKGLDKAIDKDSLYDQVVDVLTWARENGFEDAYDWIADRYAVADWRPVENAEAPEVIHTEAPCENEHYRAGG